MKNSPVLANSAWNSLVGHTWAVDLLRGALVHDRVGHAYLFTGPEHIGKTTLARLLAQALNCPESDAWQRPCGECRSCRLIAADRHPDVRLVEPEVSGRGKRTLKIENIRELQHDLNLAPYEARHKVAILTHFDSATPGAANAFLKTLEEPPKNVVILLTASEADALLPTITSRCRVLGLRPLPARFIAGALQERWQVPAQTAERLAHLADGRIGWAVGAMKEPAILEERGEHLVALSKALPAQRVQRFELADILSKDPEALPDLLRTWLSWWRDAALVAWGGAEDSALVNFDQIDTLRMLATRWKRQQVAGALSQTREALWQLEHNANARLVMENLMLGYPVVESGELEIGD